MIMNETIRDKTYIYIYIYIYTFARIIMWSAIVFDFFDMKSLV